MLLRECCSFAPVTTNSFRCQQVQEVVGNNQNNLRLKREQFKFPLEGCLYSPELCNNKPEMFS